MKKAIIQLILLLPLLGTYSQEIKSVPGSQYLEYAKATADYTWEQRDNILERWRGTIDPENIFGYRSPGGLLEMAAIYAELYKIEGRKKYAERAKEVLLTYGDYRMEFPVEGSRRQADYADGVPALPDFFTTMRYLRAYDILKTSKYLSEDEVSTIDEMIAQSLLFILRTQEWGAMNRSALRAETLSWALRVLPDHKATPTLRTLEEALVADNWGQWEIEDASLYHAVWLYALIGCADAKNEIDDLFKTPEMYYYAQYFLNLISPDMTVPDFGDAHNLQNWNRWMVFFEAAAKEYNDPEMKWAASVIANKYMDFDNTRSVGQGYMMLDCYRYGTDDIEPKKPERGSMEVMEDIVGKKIVFRDGWDEKSTYMLLNYRDEGDGGLLFRDYLRATIPIEEEKVTHGHADENSIALLKYNGSTLLSDGGYRDFLPSGYFGSFRQDYFHNRLCIRNEKIWLGQEAGEYRYDMSDHPDVEAQSIMDFMHNAGSYRKVRTQKIDFLSFPDHDYSRTRMIDDIMGYEWDRVIVNIKEPVLFVVFDVLKSRTEQFFTAANMWHTQEIVDRGEHWYDTRYDSIRNVAVGGNDNLLIYFPKNHYRFEQTQTETRNYQEEIAIAQYTAQFFEPGQHIGFVTVLVPHEEGADLSQYIDNIEYIGPEHEEDGLSVRIKLPDRILQTGIKSDMKADWTRDYRRPKYSWESGRVEYGDIETNADFFFTEQKGGELSFTVVNLTRATYMGQLLYQQPTSYFGLNFDGEPDRPDSGKARLWRGKIKLLPDNP
jgi:hypothetical protein